MATTLEDLRVFLNKMANPGTLAGIGPPDWGIGGKPITTFDPKHTSGGIVVHPQHPDWHKHQGANYWHPDKQQHGKKGKSQESPQPQQQAQVEEPKQSNAPAQMAEPTAESHYAKNEFEIDWLAHDIGDMVNSFVSGKTPMSNNTAINALMDKGVYKNEAHDLLFGSVGWTEKDYEIAYKKIATRVQTEKIITAYGQTPMSFEDFWVNTPEDKSAMASYMVESGLSETENEAMMFLSHYGSVEDAHDALQEKVEQNNEAKAWSLQNAKDLSPAMTPEPEISENNDLTETQAQNAKPIEEKPLMGFEPSFATGHSIKQGLSAFKLMPWFENEIGTLLEAGNYQAGYSKLFEWMVNENNPQGMLIAEKLGFNYMDMHKILNSDYSKGMTMVDKAMTKYFQGESTSQADDVLKVIQSYDASVIVQYLHNHGFDKPSVEYISKLIKEYMIGTISSSDLNRLKSCIIGNLSIDNNDLKSMAMMDSVEFENYYYSLNEQYTDSLIKLLEANQGQVANPYDTVFTIFKNFKETILNPKTGPNPKWYEMTKKAIMDGVSALYVKDKDNYFDNVTEYLKNLGFTNIPIFDWDTGVNPMKFVVTAFKNKDKAGVAESLVSKPTENMTALEEKLNGKETPANANKWASIPEFEVSAEISKLADKYQSQDKKYNEAATAYLNSIGIYPTEADAGHYLKLVEEVYDNKAPEAVVTPSLEQTLAEAPMNSVNAWEKVGESAASKKINELIADHLDHQDEDTYNKKALEYLNSIGLYPGKEYEKKYLSFLHKIFNGEISIPPIPEGVSETLNTETKKGNWKDLGVKAIKAQIKNLHVKSQQPDGGSYNELVEAYLKSIGLNPGEKYSSIYHSFLDDIFDGTLTDPGYFITPTVNTPKMAIWDQGLIDSLKPIEGSHALGSTEGGTYIDKDGGQYYVKFLGEERAGVESLASGLYRLAGVPVADVLASSVQGKNGAVISRWIPGAKSMTMEEMKQHPEVMDNFILDAWLANWDVIGLDADNIVLGADGKAHRIDTGGSLYYRATGATKDFTADVPELTSMKTSNKAGQVFKDLTMDNLNAGVQAMASISSLQMKQLIDKIPGIPNAKKESLHQTLMDRKVNIIKAVAEQMTAKNGTSEKKVKTETNIAPEQMSYGGKLDQEAVSKYEHPTYAAHKHPEKVYGTIAKILKEEMPAFTEGNHTSNQSKFKEIAKKAGVKAGHVDSLVQAVKDWQSNGTQGQVIIRAAIAEMRNTAHEGYIYGQSYFITRRGMASQTYDELYEKGRELGPALMIMAEMTRAYMKMNRPETVKVYRGVGSGSGIIAQDLTNFAKTYKKTPNNGWLAMLNPGIYGYSFNQGTSSSFGSGGILFSKQIPAEAILIYPNLVNTHYDAEEELIIDPLVVNLFKKSDIKVSWSE